MYIFKILYRYKIVNSNFFQKYCFLMTLNHVKSAGILYFSKYFLII